MAQDSMAENGMTQDDFPGPYALPRIIRGNLPVLIGWTLVVLAVGAVEAAIAFKQPALMLVLILFSTPLWLPLGLFWLWQGLNAPAIQLASDGVRYSTRRSRRELCYADIARVEAWMTRGRSRYGGYAVPVLGVYARASEEPTILISSKPFSKRDVAITVDAIVTANPSVELNALARLLRRGDVD